ncbi:phytanoyl-CoA dioxygenase family protein [Paraglaciecola aestuariivivens]
MGTNYAQEYNQQGFIKLCQFFSLEYLAELRQIIEYFHKNWCKQNQDFYQAGAINSSGLTAKSCLNTEQTKQLFKLISHADILAVVDQIIATPLFLNTQLFFDPLNSQQKNYWHRDPQYHLTEEQQKQALLGPEVLHVRIPLTIDPGIEVIPGSHKNWDTAEELAVRLEKSGHKNHQPLSNGLPIALIPGDILFFSANMIHRGLYGHNRLALDIIYCEDDVQLYPFIEAEHQPDPKLLNSLPKGLFLSAKSA